MAFLKKTVEVEKRTVTFTLGNGLKVVACLDDMPEHIVTQLALHGLSQKGGDSTSGDSKTSDYAGAFGHIQGAVDNLMAGEWEMRGGSSDLAIVLADMQGLDVEDVAARLRVIDEEQLGMLKKHPEVKLRIAELQRKRLEAAAKAAPDLGAMMKDLLKG